MKPKVQTSQNYSRNCRWPKHFQNFKELNMRYAMSHNDIIYYTEPILTNIERVYCTLFTRLHTFHQTAHVSPNCTLFTKLHTFHQNTRSRSTVNFAHFSAKSTLWKF